jgi:hypothetical protein
MHGIAMRVPTPTVSIVDLVVNTGKSVTAEAANDAFREAAAGRMKGILAVEDEELVSVDYKGNPHSSIVDSPSTMVMGDKMLKVMSWYDNEWGYSCRVADLINYMVSKGSVNEYSYSARGPRLSKVAALCALCSDAFAQLRMNSSVSAGLITKFLISRCVV